MCITFHQDSPAPFCLRGPKPPLALFPNTLIQRHPQPSQMLYPSRAGNVCHAFQLPSLSSSLCRPPQPRASTPPSPVLIDLPFHPAVVSDQPSPDLLQGFPFTFPTGPGPSEQLLLPLSVPAEEAGNIPGFCEFWGCPHTKKLWFLCLSSCRDENWHPLGRSRFRDDPCLSPLTPTPVPVLMQDSR